MSISSYIYFEIMKTIFFAFCNCLIALQLCSQNIVPNPSFEQTKNLPGKAISGNLIFRDHLHNWFGANGGTADLRMFQESSLRKCRTFHDDCNDARTGKAAGGIITYFTGNDATDSYREYLQVKLKKPMLKGKSYYFEMWVVKYLRGRLVSNNIGAYFSMNPFKRTSPEPLELKPVVNCDSIIYASGEQWIKISDTIVMEDNARYLLIGNFTGNENIKTDTVRSKGEMYAYYLIDDVLIYDETSPPSETSEVVDNELEKKVEIPTFDPIYYETNLATFNTVVMAQLDSMVRFLEKQPKMKVVVQGHTDDVGSTADNLTLSLQRAITVEQYLVQKGIIIDRVNTQGFGAGRPVASNDSIAGRAANRRVVVKIME